MLTPQTQDPTTHATIVIMDPGPFSGSTGPFSTQTTQIYEFIDTVGFTYSSDPTIVGDPFTVAIPNPKGDYTNRLLVGATVQLFLENPNVSGGRTLKQTGLIVRRRVQSDGQGTMIYLECADLGWHLLNNDAPLWSNLTNAVTIAQLVKRKGWIDPSWGISTTPRFDNLTSRNVKTNNARTGAAINAAPQVDKPVQRVQVEPGDKIADVLITYARRQNAFMNVGVDGVIQFWNPDYQQKPTYTFEYHPPGTSRSSFNNILEATLEEDLSTRWTQVTCVCEKLILTVLAENNLLPLDINATKDRGTINEQPSLMTLLSNTPFAHRLIFSDGEIYEQDDTVRLARWRYERGKYDSWKLTYVVKDHYQIGPSGGTWYEADHMCEVNDSVNGIFGKYYISAVNYARSERDQTTITIRVPGFLSAWINSPNFIDLTRQRRGKNVQTKGTIKAAQ